jgi:hypothetical protein
VTARVTAEAVKEVVSTSLSDDVVLTNHIDTANVLVDEHLGASGLSDALLQKIELYLAAHYVALTEEGGALTRDKIGDADQSYANIYDMGLKGTRFGQQALALDSTGALSAATTSSLKAEFRVV